MESVSIPILQQQQQRKMMFSPAPIAIGHTPVTSSAQQFKKDLELGVALSRTAFEMHAEEQKSPHKLNVQEYCAQYMHEVKENYLLKQIITALTTIQNNKAKCDYLAKQMDASKFVQTDVKQHLDVNQELDLHIKALQTKYNSHVIYSDESDWDTLKHCLRYLSQTDLDHVKNMLTL